MYPHFEASAMRSVAKASGSPQCGIAANLDFAGPLKHTFLHGSPILRNLSARHTKSLNKGTHESSRVRFGDSMLELGLRQACGWGS